MSARLVALALCGSVLLVAACGDVYADLESGTVAPAPIVPDKIEVEAEIQPVFCPREEPVPRHLADGGSNDVFDPDAGRSMGSFDHCSRTGACEYGDSADRQCNRVYTCDGSSWTLTKSGSCHDEVCPARSTSMESLHGRPCELPNGGAGDEAVCNVLDGLCACTTGAGGTDVHERRWDCSAPLLRDCPLKRPLLGEPCEGARYCEYGACTTKRGFAMQCEQGVWRAAAPVCKK